MDEIKLTSKDGEPTVDSITLAEQCEIQHQAVLKILNTHQKSIEEAFNPIGFEIRKPDNQRLTNNSGPGRPTRVAYLTESQATFVITLFRNTPPVVRFKLTLVRAFDELRKNYNGFKLPGSYEEALRELADTHEEKLLIASERDEAIRTKAWISDSKTATAMATASAEKRKRIKAEEELEKQRVEFGMDGDYLQVKGIGWLRDYFDLSKKGAYSQIGRVLSNISSEMNLDTKSVPDPQWGSVKKYSTNAIDEFKARIDRLPGLLNGYRAG